MQRWIASIIVLAACSKTEVERPSHDDCVKLSDRIAELIIASYREKPDELWDKLEHPAPGIPAEVTKESFGAFLATEPGKAWLAKRLEMLREGTRASVDECVRTATKKQIACALAANNRADIDACDRQAR